MWLWIESTAVPVHDTYWTYGVIEEFERIFGRKPFENMLEDASLLESARALMRAEYQNVIVHYGEGRLNAATSACVIAEIERNLADGGLKRNNQP